LNISQTRSTFIPAAVLVAAAASSFAVTANGATGRHTAAGTQASLDRQLSLARSATVKYATGIALARRSGYRIITRNVPGLGFRFMKAAVSGFDVRRPAILVYEHRGQSWQLGALEWVFRSRPTTPPLPGARYGSFRAGCHYADGTFVPAGERAGCPGSAPRTGAPFTLWHPRLVTMNVWLWSANPDGLFAKTNPAVDYVNPLAAAYASRRDHLSLLVAAYAAR
jgi:hypothetical protein